MLKYQASEGMMLVLLTDGTENKTLAEQGTRLDAVGATGIHIKRNNSLDYSTRHYVFVSQRVKCT